MTCTSSPRVIASHYDAQHLAVKLWHGFRQVPVNCDQRFTLQSADRGIWDEVDQHLTRQDLAAWHDEMSLEPGWGCLPRRAFHPDLFGPDLTFNDRGAPHSVSSLDG